jgi:hypothetical protein
MLEHLTLAQAVRDMEILNQRRLDIILENPGEAMMESIREYRYRERAKDQPFGRLRKSRNTIPAHKPCLNAVHPNKVQRAARKKQRQRK